MSHQKRHHPDIGALAGSLDGAVCPAPPARAGGLRPRRARLRAYALACATLAAASGAWGRSVSAAPKPIVQRAFTVVIDPGHGGSNAGCNAEGGSTMEKDYTLAVAVAVAAGIRDALPHARVVLTRESDVTLTLSERVELANAAKADLFISIHANASPDHTQTGFETYVLEADQSLKTQATAARKQAAGAPKSDVDAMLRQLGMSGNRTQALAFAKLVQGEFISGAPGHRDRGVREAPFDVLMGAQMPAVLTEVGFLDHPQEGAWMRSTAGQAAIVDALVRATIGYYRKVHLSTAPTAVFGGAATVAAAP